MRSLALSLVFVAVVSGGASAARSKGPSVDDCLSCHSDLTLKNSHGHAIFVAKGAFEASVHGQAGLACVDCHAGFNPEEMPHKKKMTAVDCSSCHSDVGIRHPFHPQTLVSCQSCHGSHDISSPTAAGSRLAGKKLLVTCASCHEDEVRDFQESQHGKSLAAGAAGAPDCLSCHRQGGIVPAGSSAAAATKIAQEKLCLSCHLDNPQIRARMPSAGFIHAYETSVHGQALAKGNARAANCVDCHSSHGVRKSFDLQSTVNRFRIPALCARCHRVEADEFGRSVHGTALARGNRDAPACTDCHGEHNIREPKDSRSQVSAANVSARVCTPCHGSLGLAQKYALPSDRAQTFADSYHGMALEGGAVAVANCASCHGNHDILPSSDPASRVNPKNLARTCGRCHPGANARFATGRVHVALQRKQQPLLFWIAAIYIGLIVVVIGGMLLHNAFDCWKRSWRLLKIRRGEIVEHPPGRMLYVRMTVSERIQHAALFLSFATLAVTGFMLRFPDAWWVSGVRRFIPHLFAMRSLLHRIAAVVMVAASVFHVGYLALTARGRRLVRDLWPRWQDVRDVFGILRYYAGLSREKPRFDRFSYIEKAEYWALVWGTIVMTVTGVIMWFDNTFIGLLSKLGYDVSRLIHFYEACLATLAILVWHFYFVIFNPDTYPMNMSWITGKLTEREMEDEHPLELERLRGADTKPPDK